MEPHIFQSTCKCLITAFNLPKAPRSVAKTTKALQLVPWFCSVETWGLPCIWYPFVGYCRLSHETFGSCKYENFCTMNFDIRWYFISVTIYHVNIRNERTPCHILEYNEKCYYGKPSKIFGQNQNTFWFCSRYIMNNISPEHRFVN